MRFLPGTLKKALSPLGKAPGANGNGKTSSYLVGPPTGRQQLRLRRPL